MTQNQSIESVVGITIDNEPNLGRTPTGRFLAAKLHLEQSFPNIFQPLVTHDRIPIQTPSCVPQILRHFSESGGVEVDEEY